MFASEFGPEVEPGLYMLRPYAPGKIPVVFVHGLTSSPVAFVQAINDFQNDPVLSARYQFWMFVYPTGRPIVRSALRLREALGRAEAAYGADPAFHRMVVVGHSMGGILTHMIVSDSGREVWDGVLNVPPEALRASPATRAALDQLLFFHPLPYVRRVVFIATPHRGSRLANGLVGRFFGGRIRPPADQAAAVPRSRRGTGPTRSGTRTSGASRSTRSATSGSIARCCWPSAGCRWRRGCRTTRSPSGSPATPPATWSSRSGAPAWMGPRRRPSSRATHGSEQSPPALGELRRILLEHLAGP